MADRASLSLQGSGNAMLSGTPRGATPRMATPRMATPQMAIPRMATPRMATPRQMTPRVASSSSQVRPAASQSQWAERPESANRPIQDMSIQEMEEALKQKLAKRHGGQSSHRENLETNKRLIEAKREQKLLARQDSREFVQRILEEDRIVLEGRKADALNRRKELSELANHYKETMERNTEAKKAAKKASVGSASIYFPYVEGENIVKKKEAEKSILQGELREFMQKQNVTNPARQDNEMRDNKKNTLDYPIRPNPVPHGSTPPFIQTSSWTQELQDLDMEPNDPHMQLVDEKAAHLSKHPVFLTKAKEHMSRRLHDSHVRKALEEKVEQTKTELLHLANKRQSEALECQDGLLVGDALRYDSTAAKAEERRRHAQYLKQQIREREQREQKEKAARRDDQAGYWGPEDKPTVSSDAHKHHCADLIKQMKVDQIRKIIQKDERLKQEKQLIGNCYRQIEEDRIVEQQKRDQYREVLVTTWKSQQKIQEVKRTIDGIM
eukprot:TRINITY_DN11478_c0_g1_i1.p1 TRINITY_DN11478_c0_g1~~TRINITY_DN11478_c0_g1_i1.p1  ORF type:complete len:497 (+),score=100.91 TRINITY_DN11478_c0_g1_i1:68-1558(+)